MTDSSGSEFVCRECNDTFPSRNKLFRHVRTHASQRSTDCKGKGSVSDTSSSTPSHSCCSLAEIPPHFVYVLGGRLRGRTLNAVWRFSSARHFWEDCPAGRMLENRGSHGAGTVDEVIYVVGGGGLHSNLSSCEKFDGKSWQRVAALNVSRHALAVTSHRGYIFAVGGWVDGTTCSPATEAYDCSTTGCRDQWDNLPDLVMARKLHGCAVLHDKLYVFGGSCDEPLWHTNTVEVLDLAAVRREQDAGEGFSKRDTASVYEEEKKDDACAESVQTKEERRLAGIKACEEGDTRRSTTAAYRPYQGSAQWTVLPTRLPSKGGGASAVAVGDHIFVFLHGKRVCRYDSAHDAYTELSELPVEDWHCFDVCAVSGQGGRVQAAEVYVVGGASKGAWTKVAYLYNTQHDSWIELPSMPQAKRRMACSVVLETST